MYRMQKIDRRTTLMHWQIHKDGRADYLFANGRLEVAVALGLDPVSAYSASAPLPKHIDEFMLAGFLKGSAVELTPAKTISVDVPANAEVVLEGYVETGDLAPEGRSETTPATTRASSRSRLSRHGADDAQGRDLPLDRRREAAAGGRMARQADRADLPPGDLMTSRSSSTTTFPSRARSTTAASSRSRNSSRPRAEGDARDLGPRAALIDEVGRRRGRGVDVHDYEEVFFRVCANVDPKRDVLLTEGRSTTSTTRRRCSSTAASSGSMRRTKERPRGRGSGRPKSR
jgi:hypothetical protein